MLMSSDNVLFCLIQQRHSQSVLLMFIPTIFDLSFFILISSIFFIFIILATTLTNFIQLDMDASNFSNTPTSITKEFAFISVLISQSLSSIFTAVCLGHWNSDFHKNCGPWNHRLRCLLFDPDKPLDA